MLSCTFKNPFQKAQNRGFSLIVVIMITAGIAVVATAVLQFIPIFKKESLKTSDELAVKMFLQSSVDYTIAGVKNRWCFSTTWAQSKQSCNFSNAKFTERLLLSSSAVTFLQAATPGMSDPRLTSISQTVSMSALTGQHPLSTIASALPPGVVSSLKFTLERITNANYGATDRDVYLKVRVEAFTSNNRLLRFTKAKYWSEAVVAVHPRELSTNTLVLAGSLRLDLSGSPTGVCSGMTNGVGNACVPTVTKATSSIYAGLNFDGPVFVNGDIVLPDESTTSYAPVTFRDTTFLGSGILKSGGTAASNYFRPTSTSSRFLNQLSNAGGFLKGIVLDRSDDLGLVSMRSTSASPPSLNNVMNQCIARTNALFNLSNTKTSTVAIRSKTANPQVTSSYILGINEFNQFFEQDGMNPGLASLSPSGWQVEAKGAPQSTKSILQAQIRIGSKSVTVNMDRASKVRIVLDSSSSSSSSSSVSSEAYSSATSSSYSSSYSSYSSASYSSAPDDDDDEGKSGEVVIETSPYKVGNKEQPHKINLDVTFKNTKSIKDSVSVQIEAYDVGYTNGVFDRETTHIRNGLTSSNIADRRTVGSLTWTRASGGLFTPPNIPAGGFKALNSASTYANQFQTDLYNNPLTLGANFDLATVADECNAGSGTGFGVATYNTSFTSQSESSWHFSDGTQRTPGATNLIIDSAVAGSLAPTFLVKSLMGTCTIKPSAVFFTGFLGCRNLIIEDGRTAPLRIIGTILVTRNMQISSSALQYGIDWSPIYSTRAIRELRSKNVLKGATVACSDIPGAVPAWHPMIGFQDFQNAIKCSPLSLRAKAAPFQWTQVDPDCGKLTGAVTNSCKHRDTKFVIEEITRSSSGNGGGL